MRALPLIAIALVACSSTTNVFEIVSDAGARDAKSPALAAPMDSGEIVDAPVAVTASDAASVDAGIDVADVYVDVIAVDVVVPVDAGSDAAAVCMFDYLAPPVAVSPFTTYANLSPPYTCDISCGASGPYSYGTGELDARPPLNGCTQIRWHSPSGAAEPLFCCPELACMRAAGGDGACVNPKFPEAFNCTGPAGGPAPAPPDPSCLPNGLPLYCCP